jgi:hypothetical protein
VASTTKIIEEIDKWLAEANADRRHYIQSRHFIEASACAIRIAAYENCRRLLAIQEKAEKSG